jgi:ATP-binding cassette subfamily B protein
MKLYAGAGHTGGLLAGAVTGPGPLFSASGNPAAPAHSNRDSARRVVPLFRPYRAQVAAVVGLIVLTSTIGIVNPLLIQAVFNKALFVPGGPNLQLLVILVAIMAIVPIVNGAIGILQTYETTRVGQQVMRDLRDRLYAHLQTLSLAFFTGTKTGEIQSRLANDVGGVQTVVTTTASTILGNLVTFASTVVAMVILSWQLTIVAVFTVPVFFWLTKKVGERRRRVARSTQESLAAMSALSEETLSVSGVLLAKVFGNQARDTARYHEENQRLADLEVRQQMIGQGRGQHPLRPSCRLHDGGRRSRPRGVHPRPGHGVPRRLRHDRGRAGVPPVRRGETAPGHRAGPAARPPHPDPGRGDLGARHCQ